MRHIYNAVIGILLLSLGVSRAAILYVNANSSGPLPPFASWSTAAADIQSAVDAANAGDTVLVTNGVYQTGSRATPDGTTNRLVVAKALTIVSVNGPSATSIDGGATLRCLYLTNGVVLNGFTVTNGSAGTGAGVYCAGTNAWLVNCTLANNTATTGGGIYSGMLTNCTLAGNSCPVTGASGGGAYGAVLYNCTLTGNSTGRPYPNSTGGNSGGGAAACTLYNCTISGNSSAGAGCSGGGVSGCMAYSCTFSGNTSEGDGGAAYSCTLTNCTLSNNHGGSGGGICEGLATHCTFTGNVADGWGGAAYYNVTLNYCTISGSFAGWGAAVSGCTLNYCSVVNNQGSYGVGEHYSTLNNCLVANNKGYQGVGGYQGTFNNCTIVSNTASYEAGGEYNATLNNCINYYNTAASGYYPDNQSGTLNYSCTPDASGTGCITNAPLFVNVAGGDFHLLSNSPCINTGNNAYVASLTDLDGVPRVIDNVVDMGTYEFQSAGYIVIQAQTPGQTAIAERTVVFSATAVSPLPLSYQWQFNATNLPNATNASLVLSNVQSNNAGLYDVVVSNSLRSVSSTNVTLTVLYPPPAIVTQPSGILMTAGSNAVFSCVATSYFALNYQWQFNGTNVVNGGRISGATTSTLSIANAQPGDNGPYQVSVYDKYGNFVTSSPSTLTVLAGPGISSPPQDMVVTRFYQYNLSVTATGAPNLYFQWRKQGTNLVDAGDLSGSGTSTLTFTDAKAVDTGMYDVIVSNSFGIVTSSVANVTAVPVFLWGDSYTPPPPTATNIVAVAAGGDLAWGDFNMALRGDGAVIAWGGGYNGSTTVSASATNVVAIAAGDFFGLALRRDGAVVGWGDNTYSEATPPPSATNVIAIAAGHYHGLALKADGTVIGWGENSYGESAPPAGVSNVVAIAAGGNYSLALLQNGTIVGWGNTNYGVTMPPPNATNVIAIAAGEDHAVALRTDGSVVGWGSNAYGYDVVPANATNVMAVAAGNTFSAALRADGTMLNWGYGDNGSAYTPPYITNIVAISAKEYQNLVLVQDSSTQIAPMFSRQPGNVSVATAQTAILNPQVIGSLPISHQWYFDGVPLGGQTNNWLALISIGTAQAGSYQLVATNNFGAVTSVVATVSEPPGISTQPAGVAVFVGGNATFTATALGIGPFGYQWYSNGVMLADSARFSGSGTNSLTISNIQLSDAASYSLQVTNPQGASTTIPAVLSVVTQPTNVMVLQGTTAMLTVNSAGTMPVLYQWEENGSLLANGGRISGATNSGLLISGALTADSGAYQVVVAATNSSITSTSAVATLSVLAPASITGQPSSQAVLIGGVATFTAGVSGSALGYQWFENGLPLADSAHIGGSTTGTLNIFNVQSGDVGSYSLLVSNGLSSAGSMGAVLTPLTVAGPSTRYVNLNNTNPTLPYLSWGTAATNIQDAIDAAVNGDTITVTDGVYQAGGRVMFGTMTNRVAINKAVLVQSVNGLAATTIAGNRSLGVNAVRCVYLTNNATLIGFTLTGGATRTSSDAQREESGGGAWCVSTNARILNCLIISNSAWINGGGECFGTLSNCTLVGNSVTNLYPAYGGGAYGGMLYNCILSNNAASANGGGSYSNFLFSCVLLGNQATNRSGFTTSGGGAFLSKLSFCVVSNNYSGPGVGGGVSFSVLNSSQIFSNFSTSYGGGGEYSLFTNCTILGNQSGNSGAGADGSVMNNCLVALNHIVNSSAGAAANNSTSICCTIVGNSTTYAGGLGGLISGKALNSIVYSNLGANSYVTTMTNCCTYPMPEGAPAGNFGVSGVFTNAPLFVNFAGGDFHLQANSPCINAGKNLFVTTAVDLDGNPRIQGGTVDVGAYEYQTPASILPYVWAQQYGLATDGSVDNVDSDGTGMSNWQKWIAGLNPTNPASGLAMGPLAHTNNAGGIKVIWQSVNTRVYYLMRSTNLPQFTSIQSNIVGQTSTTMFTDTSATNAGPYFYRVGVQ